MFLPSIFCITTFFLLLETGLRGDKVKDIQKIIVLHRHSIIPPLHVPELEIQEGKNELTLTDPGIELMRALGLYLRERYEGKLPVRWKPDQMYAQSTNQVESKASAQVLLATLFRHKNDFPVVFAPSEASDDDLLPWSPSLILRNTSNLIDSQEIFDVRELFSLGALKEIAELSGVSVKLCLRYPNRCIYFAAQKAAYACMEQIQTFKDPPPFGRYYAKMITAYRRSSHYRSILMGVDPRSRSSEGEFRRQVGALAYPLLSKNLCSETNFTSKDNVQLRVYAAQEATLVRVYGAIGLLPPGLYNSPLNSPQFGEAILIEITIYNKLRFYRLLPHRTIQNFTYEIHRLGLPWKNSEGQKNNNECDEGYSRPLWCAYFKEHHAPQSPDGLCYIDPFSLHTHSCDLTETIPTHACAVYRRRCPLQGCPQGSILTRDLRCIKFGSPRYVWNKYHTILFLLNFFTSLMAGFFFARMFCHL